MFEELREGWNEHVEAVELELDLHFHFVCFPNSLCRVVHSAGGLVEELDHVRHLRRLVTHPEAGLGGSEGSALEDGPGEEEGEEGGREGGRDGGREGGREGGGGGEGREGWREREGEEVMAD